MPSDYFIAHFRDQRDGFLGGCRDNFTWRDALTPLYPNVNELSCCVSEPALLSHGGRDTPVLGREPQIAGGWPACFLAVRAWLPAPEGSNPRNGLLKGLPKGSQISLGRVSPQEEDSFLCWPQKPSGNGVGVRRLRLARHGRETGPSCGRAGASAVG